MRLNKADTKKVFKFSNVLYKLGLCDIELYAYLAKTVNNDMRKQAEEDRAARRRRRARRMYR